MTAKLRLGFHYHIPAVLRESQIYMPGYLGRFIDSLAVHCGQVVCFLHSPRADELDLLSYPVASDKVSLVDIGAHASALQRSLVPGRYTQCLRNWRTAIDLLLIRGPSPLLPAMSAAMRPQPTALLLVGDYLAAVNDTSQPRWRQEANRLWSYWNKAAQDRAVRHSLTFVNSRVLFKELRGRAPDLREVRTTTITADDIFEREDTCTSAPVRLLYAGRMDRAKGLLHMVEALALLAGRGEDVVLELVGWSGPGDPILDKLHELACERNVADRVGYLGQRALGPELFKCYRQADIFVIASLAEGFPRAIWEAMASSLPVVASAVGSIPAFTEGAAMLVPPGEPGALADAVARLIHEPELRRDLIRRGLGLARANTLENQIGDMVAQMDEWLRLRRD